MALTAAVVDTSAIIAFFRGDPGAAALMARLDRLVVPVAVVAELHAGTLGVGRKASGMREIGAFLDSSRVSIAPFTAGTAERWAVIWDSLRRAGRPIPINDVWIAACAMEHGLPVATNDRHFLSVPQVMAIMVAGQEM